MANGKAGDRSNYFVHGKESGFSKIRETWKAKQIAAAYQGLGRKRKPLPTRKELLSYIEMVDAGNPDRRTYSASTYEHAIRTLLYAVIQLSKEVKKLEHDKKKTKKEGSKDGLDPSSGSDSASSSPDFSIFEHSTGPDKFGGSYADRRDHRRRLIAEDNPQRSKRKHSSPVRPGTYQIDKPGTVK